MAGQPFGSALEGSKMRVSVTHVALGEIGRVTHTSPHASKQKPGTRMVLSKRDLWMSLLSNGVNP